MAEEKKTEQLEGSLTDGGSLPGEDDERSFGGERKAEGGRLPPEPDASTQRGKDLPDGGYESPEGPTPGQGARGYGG